MVVVAAAMHLKALDLMVGLVVVLHELVPQD